MGNRISYFNSARTCGAYHRSMVEFLWSVLNGDLTVSQIRDGKEYVVPETSFIYQDIKKCLEDKRDVVVY
jgi:hypothetical protein